MRKVIIFLLIFFFILSFSISFYSFFSISRVTIQGAEAVEGISPYYKKLIFFVNTREVERHIYASNPALENVHVVRIYPDTINISVAKASSIAKLRLQDGYMAISLKNRIVAKQRGNIEEVPLEMTYYGPLYFRNFSVGEDVDIQEVSDAVFFINEVNKLAIPISKVAIKNENMIVLMSEAGEIYVSSTKDVNKQVAQLRTVLEHSKIQSLAFKRIDVRFDKPIVVFK